MHQMWATPHSLLSTHSENVALLPCIGHTSSTKKKGRESKERPPSGFGPLECLHALQKIVAAAASLFVASKVAFCREVILAILSISCEVILAIVSIFQKCRTDFWATVDASLSIHCDVVPPFYVEAL